MYVLRHSITLRWGCAWIFISGALALATFLITGYTGKQSVLGNDFLSQYGALLIFAAPWFLWGAILVKFVHNQKQYSFFRRIISILGLVLMFIIIIYATGLITINW